MIRKSARVFRPKLELGGVEIPFDPPNQVKSMSEHIAHVLNLDYCGIDVLFGQNGYYVCEVNSNAFFGGIEKVSGINIARLYAQHINNCI